MRYAGWNRKKLGEQHYQWDHTDSNTEVELYRYGVKSYVEVRLGTRRIDFKQLQYEYSDQEDAKRLAYAVLDSIQAGFRTSERLEEEGFGQFGFHIEKDENQRMEQILQMSLLGNDYIDRDQFFDYMNNLLNHFGTNHYFESGSGYPSTSETIITVYKEEPFSMDEKDLKRQRRKVKQELRESREFDMDDW